MANTPLDSIEKHVSRRQALASGAAVVAGGTGLATLAADPTRAAVSIDDFAVETTTITP